MGLFDELRDDPEGYVNDVLRHIGARSPWTPPAKFLKEKILATKSVVDHEREIPELVKWYIADQLLEPTERLNELLEGRVSNWVEELRADSGRTRHKLANLEENQSYRPPGPEGLAYEAYHAVLDVRLWRRWQHLQTVPRSGVLTNECLDSFKLGATGDVVRTTPLLRLSGEITWITAANNTVLLESLQENLRVFSWEERERALDRHYDLAIKPRGHSGCGAVFENREAQ